jgi:hypothetical protein
MNFPISQLITLWCKITTIFRNGKENGGKNAGDGKIVISSLFPFVQYANQQKPCVKCRGCGDCFG